MANITTTSTTGPTGTELVTTESVTKPGYKTTEFYLAFAAMLLSTAYASGLMTNNTVLAVAGVVASILASMGYSVSRGLAKKAA